MTTTKIGLSGSVSSSEKKEGEFWGGKRKNESALYPGRTKFFPKRGKGGRKKGDFPAGRATPAAAATDEGENADDRQRLLLTLCG